MTREMLSVTRGDVKRDRGEMLNVTRGDVKRDKRRC